MREVGIWVVGLQGLAVLQVGAAYLLAPRAAGGGAWFGVPVAPGFAATAEGGRIAGGYRRAVVGWTLASLVALAALALLAADAWPGLAAAGLVTLAQVGGCTAAWSAAHRASLPHAVPTPGSMIRRASLGPVTGALRPAMDLVGFLILGAAALYLWSRWDQLPERFPVHWGPSGPDRWGTRRPADVFGPLGFGAGMVAMMVALRWVLAWQLPAGATPRAQATRRLGLDALQGTGWFIAGLTAVGALTPLAGGPEVVIVGAGVGMLVLLVASVVALVRLSALPPDPPGPPPPAGALRWGGLLYANPEDPALWVPKGAGLGYTVNLGHPRGKLTLALLVGLPIALSLGLAWLTS